MKCILIAGALILGGCGPYVQQGDSSQVSVLHVPGSGYGDVYARARAHCGRYGKKAVVQGRFSSEETVFACR